jgi:hypothetical protein
VRTELQGLYDESSQAALQFATETDVDQFHQVLCTADWVFVDAAGARHPWSEARAQAIRALAEPRADSMLQRIDKVSLASGGATVMVTAITVRHAVDADGRYGRKGASRTLTETTVFRDQWIRNGDFWKLKSREQIGQPKVVAAG